MTTPPRAAARVTSPVAAVVAAGYAFAITMAGTTLPTPLYPNYERELGIGSLVVTVVFATYAVFVVAGLVLFGRLSDEVGRRPVLAAGLLLSAASAVVFLLARDLAALLVGRALSGLSAGVFTGTATAARPSRIAALAGCGPSGCGSPPPPEASSSAPPPPARAASRCPASTARSSRGAFSPSFRPLGAGL